MFSCFRLLGSAILSLMQAGKIRNLWLFNFMADYVAIVAAYFTTLAIRINSGWGESLFEVINTFLGVRESGSVPYLYAQFYLTSALRITSILAMTLCVLYALFDLYPGRRFIRRRPISWSIIRANVVALVLFYAYFYLRRNVFHPRSFFAMVLFLNVFFCVGFRRGVYGILQLLRRRYGFDRCNALLVGRTEEASFLNVYVNELHPHGLYLESCLEWKEDQSFDGFLGTVKTVARDSGADMIVVADKRFTMAQIMKFLGLGEALDVPVKVLSEELSVLMSRAGLSVDTVSGVPFVHFPAPSVSRRFAGVKRAISLIIALGLTLLTLPVMAVIAVLIRLTSRGPVLFVQERIGMNEKPFRMYKFRTMYERSDEIQAQVEEFNESGPGLFKIRKDPRVTPVGRFLRRFSLDELPQLINVVRGNMSLVGPRPLPRRDFEHYYEEWHYLRHSGKPGLTCLWQISGRSDIDFFNMCILDVYYLRNQNWVLDLKIVLNTIWVVLFAKGAY